MRATKYRNTRLADRAANVELGSALADARYAAGLSQRQLASRLHRAHSYVAKIEHSQRGVHVSELVAIARVVSIDPVEFIANLARMLIERETANAVGGSVTDVTQSSERNARHKKEGRRRDESDGSHCA